MNKKILIIIIIIAFAVSGVVFLVIKKGSASLFSNNRNANNQESSGSANKSEENLKLYENYDFGFGFLYPKDFEITELDEEAGFTVLVSNPEAKETFQVFLLPFDEPDPVTPERIRKDVPDMLIKDPAAVKIGVDKDTDALIFESESEKLGATREIWFIRGGYLFQVSTYTGHDNFIGPIMDTFRFVE